MSVFAFTVSRATTPSRAALLSQTITGARANPKHPFTWMLIVQKGTLGAEVANAAFNSKQVDLVLETDDNVGQHVAWNLAIEKAREMGATYFLRLDDDVEFPTKGWLQKLVEFSGTMNDKFIVSPVVKGLSNPVPRSELGVIKDYRVEVLTEAIGGICRFHPMALLDHPEHPFVADVRKAMGGGDATGMGQWCLDNVIVMVYAHHVRVKHALTTKGQMTNDPEHFANHDLLFHLPYVPAWRRDTAS